MDLTKVSARKAERPFVLSIDIGTSSVRVLLFDAMGREVNKACARQGLNLSVDAMGAAVTDPDQVLGITWLCVDQVLDSIGPLAAHIAGVATCTFVSSLMGVNKTGRAITPLVTYADTRATREASSLRNQLGEVVIHQRTGCHFHPSYWPAQLRYLMVNRPDLVGRVKRWITLGEYMTMLLFGEAAISYSAASWTGLLNRITLDWDGELLAAIPITNEQLSPFVDVDTPWRGLQEEFANRWPSLGEVPWFPAIGDGAAANLGCGCVDASRLAVTIGTSSAIRATLDSSVSQIPAGLWCYMIDRKLALIGGALAEGGNLFDWLVQTLRLDNNLDLEAAFRAMQPNRHGLCFLPLLGGERSPGWDGERRGAIAGISMATTPLELLKAGMEGVAFRISLVYELLRAALNSDPQVIASGGAIIHSPVWLQIIADVIGRPVTVSLVREASARGSALLALKALRIINDLENTPDCTGAIFEPLPSNHAAYKQAAKLQQVLYNQLSQIDHASED